jgi:enamine deaminase RidA (YjgF/YER057c/UK114 family)
LGHAQSQVSYLKGLSHLSPTYVYDVAFERGTMIQFGDRRHIYISGTASIDHEGNILFPGNVLKQYKRTIENIEVLAKEGGAELKNIAQFLVYLRNPSNYQIISKQIAQQFPDVPCIIVRAPVCRPGWLIEIEAILIAESRSNYPPL